MNPSIFSKTEDFFREKFMKTIFNLNIFRKNPNLKSCLSLISIFKKSMFEDHLVLEKLIFKCPPWNIFVKYERLKPYLPLHTYPLKVYVQNIFFKNKRFICPWTILCKWIKLEIVHIKQFTSLENPPIFSGH